MLDYLQPEKYSIFQINKLLDWRQHKSPHKGPFQAKIHVMFM